MYENSDYIPTYSDYMPTLLSISFVIMKNNTMQLPDMCNILFTPFVSKCWAVQRLAAPALFYPRGRRTLKRS